MPIDDNFKTNYYLEMNNILQIAYMSFATDQFNAKTDIDDILAKAKKYNEQANLTGILLYKGGVFLQLLEGDEDEVLKLFGKIGLDMRHEGLKILVKQESDTRLFPNWTMGFKRIDSIELDVINAILPWGKIIEDTQKGKQINSSKIVELLRKFRYDANLNSE